MCKTNEKKKESLHYCESCDNLLTETEIEFSKSGKDCFKCLNALSDSYVDTHEWQNDVQFH